MHEEWEIKASGERSVAIGTDARDNTVITGDQNVVNFNKTQIIQIAVEEVKKRRFIITSPYKGLKKFEPDDKDIFFGRDQFLADLVSELEQTNLILLLGASGSGKSSVVRAGLVPWLAQKWGNRLINLMLTPDQNPFESLYGSLLSRSFKQSEAQIARTGKADTLSQVVKTLKKPDSFWFIFIDQFEELFTTSNPEKRDQFLESLVKLSKEKASDKSLKIVLTMRADFIDRLDPNPANRLANITQKHRPMITQMQPDELRLAIEQPAAHHGVVFETGLVEEIIKDVQGQAGYLPLLQYTLNLLWDTQVKNGSINERTLNTSTYRNLGGVRGALQERVEEIYRNLSRLEKSATQKIFLKLVGIGEDKESGSEWKAVRRVTWRSEFKDEIEQRVLAILIDENLLVSDRQPQSQVSTVEIAHEILLTSWKTLNNWIQENHHAIALRNRLNDDVANWQAKRPDDELWSGSKLEKVLELREDNNFKEVLGGFSDVANQFIDASVGLRDRQRQRRNRVAVFLLLVLSGLTSIALYQWRNAQHTTINALDETSKASLLFNRQLEALVTAVQSGKQSKNPILFLDAAASQTASAALQRAVSNVQERNRLEGHSSAVNSVSFSPDGKTLASSSLDSVKLWDVATGTVIKPPNGLSSGGWGVVFSPDGKILAAGSLDNNIKLWNIATGKFNTLNLRGSHKLPQGMIFSVGFSFSPDGKTLASGSLDKTIKLWDVATGKLINTLKGHSSGVKSVVFSPDGKTLVSSGWHDGVKLWDVATGTGTAIKPPNGLSSGRWQGVVFSPDGKILAVGSLDDNTIKFWDVVTGTEIKPPNGLSSGVNSVVSREGKTLTAVSGPDIKLWDVATGTEINTLRGHSSGVNRVVFSPDGKTLASGSNDHSIKLWNVTTVPVIKTLNGYSSGVESVVLSLDGKTLAAASAADHSVKLWNVATGKLINILKGHSYTVYSVSFSPDGKTLASGSFDNTIKLWDVATGTEINTLQGRGWVRSVVFSPDGKTLASGSAADNSVKLWDVATGTEISTLKGHSLEVRSVVFSPDGKTLASGSHDHSVKLWDVATGTEINTLQGHSDWVSSLGFSPDSKTLASGSNDHSVKLWDVATGTEINTLQGHGDLVRSVVFSPDGKTLASGGNDDHSVKLWDVATGTEIKTLKGHSSGVSSLVFSPDGKTLASGSFDKTVKLWSFYPNNLNDLMTRSCDWLRGYLQTNPNVSDPDLCAGIGTQK